MSLLPKQPSSSSSRGQKSFCSCPWQRPRKKKKKAKVVQNNAYHEILTMLLYL